MASDEGERAKREPREASTPEAVPEHHRRFELCRTRPAYRQGRKLTAVKAYTASSESNRLLVFGVPDLQLDDELRRRLAKHGALVEFGRHDDYPSERFERCYGARFRTVRAARACKRAMDACNFYGGVVHVSYAPELETPAECRDKLLRRKRQWRHSFSQDGVKKKAEK